MYNSAGNLFRFLENLLEWSRIQRNIIEFEPQKIEFYDYLNNSIKLFEETAKQKNIVVTNVIPKSLVVFADPDMLNTVSRNLLSNAFKFSNPGGRIEIGTCNCRNEFFGDIDKFVCIYFKDTGIGMPGKILQKLFKIDEKVSRSGTDGESSTGLGLLLCKEFVEKHGGIIHAESIENQGSTFYIYLPLNEKQNIRTT